LKFLLQFFICGIITSLLFPPFFLTFIGFIIFPYLFYLANHKKYIAYGNKFHFLSGFIYGIGFFSIYLSWVIEPFLLTEETKKYSFLSYFLILYCSIYFGLIFLILKFFKEKIIKLFILPSLFVLAEYLCANFIYGFPWLSFSLINSNNIIGTSLIYYFGTYGLSFLTILFFLLPSLLIINKFKKIKYYLGAYLFVSIFLIVLIFIRINNEEYEKISLDLTLVQMNFPISQNLKAEDLKEKYKAILNVVKNSDSDLIIFAENNYPYLMTANHIEILQNQLNENNSLIIGSSRKENNNYFNTFFLIKKNSYSKYDKSILVPFGEFIPFRFIFKFMKFIAGTIDYTKGSDKKMIVLNNQINILPIICYEIVYFSNLINKNNIENNLIINLTNDSWFGDFSGPYQHFYFSKLRAAEFNKPLIRVSNNGISAFINNFGNIVYSSKLNKKEIKKIKIDIPLKNYNLLIFHKVFNFFILLNIFICLVFNRKKHDQI
tara:strand:+ start:36 stop:1505 length:1470 start_codon:yes stop_codon:yes gene_type:complete